LQWISGVGTAANYPFNTFNVVITDPANPLVRVLQPNTFFSVDGNGTATPATAATVTIIDAAGTTVTIGAETTNPVTGGYIGAVRVTANWTASWTYGLNAGNRGVTPWWE